MKSAFLSTEVALPVAAEEGFTGVLENSRLGRGETPVVVVATGLEEFGKDELFKIDGEGRCVVTDHGHFGEFEL